MMKRIALFTILLAAATGCSAVVKNTLDMKGGDGGTTDTGPTGCTTNDDCTDGNPCNGLETCESGSCRNGDSMPDGTPCPLDMGGMGMCMGAMCVPPEGCGDGVTQPPLDEECDDGANGDPNDGCTDDCHYSCHSDGECDDGFVCNGMERCMIPGVMNLRSCRPAALLAAEGTPCDSPAFTGGMCRTMMGPPLCCQGTSPDTCCGPDMTGEIVCMPTTP